MTTYTPNLALDLYEDSDKPNLRDQYNSAMNKIDIYCSTPITSAQIADGAVTSPKIYDGAVTSAKIEDGAVTETKIEPESVSRSKIAPNAIDGMRIEDGVVTQDKIADDSIVSSKIYDGAVTETKIADGAVTTPKLAADCIKTAYSSRTGSEITVAAGASTGVDLDFTHIPANKIVSYDVIAQSAQVRCITSVQWNSATRILRMFIANMGSAAATFSPAARVVFINDGSFEFNPDDEPDIDYE